MTKPARSASKGRLAVCGESLEVVHIARILLKPAKPSGVIVASLPPASITSASPYWMYLSASPSAWVPVAHALTMPKLGPMAPRSMAIIEPAVFPMMDGRRKGVMRLGPLLNRISQLCSTAERPPTPEPTSTPNRFGSKVLASSFASSRQILAAPIARCEYRSCLLASFGSQYFVTSKSRTSAAIFVWNFSGSKRVSSWIPHFPSRRLSKKVCAS
mmetsp:Transcript_23715/g.51129  ORF Transcript_23715/g.51129 Transcript_23715/m.51129 type:complete len:215 (-) Transcript_23715:280-924(-)